jgi:hypothetical protein
MRPDRWRRHRVARDVPQDHAAFGDIRYCHPLGKEETTAFGEGTPVPATGSMPPTEQCGCLPKFGPLLAQRLWERRPHHLLRPGGWLLYLAGQNSRSMALNLPRAPVRADSTAASASASARIPSLSPPPDTSRKLRPPP